VLPLVLGAVVVGLLGRLTSPFVIVPTIVATQGAAFAGNPKFIDRWWLPQVVLSLGIFVPLALEQLGAIAPTLLMRGDELAIHSAALDLSRGPIALLVIGTAVTLLAGGSLNRHNARERREAQRALEIRAFHLDQLVRR
jgi:hypothetical protein